MFVRGVCRVVLIFSVLTPLDSSPPCHQYGSPCSKSLFLPAPPGHTPSCAEHGETFCEHIEHYPEHVIEYLIEKWRVDFDSIFTNERRETKPRPMYGPPSYSYPYPPKTRFPTHYGRPRDHLRPPPPNYYNALLPSFNHILGFKGSVLLGSEYIYEFFELDAEEGSTWDSKARQYRRKNMHRGNSDYEYPERKYPLGPSALQFVDDDPGFIYSAIIHPELANSPPVTSYDPNKWWKRYTRIARKKRDTNESETKSSKGKRKKRQAGSPGAIQLCPTSPRFIMPKAALNNKGNWMYVVNLDTNQRFTQLVRSETCISSQCNGICSLPNGYTSRCEQQFVQKRLVALDGSGDKLYTDLFWLPHCCICQITQINR